MEPHARQHQAGFDPVVDTDEFRRAHRERMLAYVREYEAEHGKIDPAELEKLAAQADTWPE